jgi:hypothetical protein
MSQDMKSGSQIISARSTTQEAQIAWKQLVLLGFLNGPMLNGDLNTRTCHAREDDSATYSSIVDSKPYGDECVSKKLEFQKRVGSQTPIFMYFMYR